MMNYMDRFKTPEDFIRHEIVANKGTNSFMTKSQMIDLILSCLSADKYDQNEKELSKKTKEELYDLLRDSFSVEELAERTHIGISSYNFQQKFGITNNEVKLMASKGFISETGSERFRAYGKYMNASLYSVFDYYRLTCGEVDTWLRSNRPKRRKDR